MTTVGKPGRKNVVLHWPRTEAGKAGVSFTSPITVLTIASPPRHETAVVAICQELERAGILRMTQTDFYNPIYPEISPEQRILVVGGHLKVCLEGQLCSYVDLAERGVRVEVLLPLDLIYNQAHDTLATKLAYLKSRDNSFVARLRETPVSWLLLVDGKVREGRLKPGQAKIDFCARFFSDSQKLREYLKTKPF